MVDEIELVRQFRSDVPEPSPQARAQAWAAVTAVATEERTLAPVALPHRRRRPPSRRARQLVALAVAVAAVAAVLTVVLSPGGRPSHVPGAFTTAWQPSRPSSRPVSPSGAHNSPGALRLVSYIEGPDWKQGSKQVPPGYLDCPAIDACYLLAQTVLTTVGPFPNYYNAVYFSGDGGASWSSLALPAGLSSPPPFHAGVPWPASASATRATRTNWSLPLTGGTAGPSARSRPGGRDVPQLLVGVALQPGHREQLPRPGQPSTVRFDHRWGRQLVHPQLRPQPVHLVAVVP